MQHPSYRADIDGMRAIAVLSVMAFHLFPGILRGGFIGVDIFFVISGFLISAIIFEHLDRGTFRISEFYTRRIKRIFPALLLVLCTCLCLGWFVLLADEYKQLGMHTAAGAAFFSNIMLWRESGYFDTAAEAKPLLHLWSLGVEEQFYILWPLVVWVCWRYKNRFLPIVLAVILLSFSLSIAGLKKDAAAMFFLPHVRFWELLVGALLAYLMRYKNRLLEHITTPNADLRAGLGLVLIGAGMLIIHKQSLFPGFWVLLPVVGSALLISAGAQAWINRTVLSHPVLVWFGLISYPLYLWHWPVLFFVNLMEGSAPSLTQRWAIFCISVVLSWATYRFIERPIRFRSHQKNYVPFLCGGMILILGLGSAVYFQDGVSGSLPPFLQISQESSFEEARKTIWREHQCFLRENDTRFSDACVDRGKGPLVMLWGDSHAAAFYPGLKNLQKTRKFRIAQRTTSDCVPIIDYVSTNVANCATINAENMRFMKEMRPDHVILHAQWDNYEGHLAATIAEIKAADIRDVIVIGPVPKWHPTLLRALMNNAIRSGEVPPPYIPPDSLDKLMVYDQSLRAIAEKTGARYVSAIQALCHSGVCLSRVESELTYYDSDHLSLAGAIFLADTVAFQLFQ
jgi:peptidoglycan/LPS O-acetylase OafA/YrhL